MHGLLFREGVLGRWARRAAIAFLPVWGCDSDNGGVSEQGTEADRGVRLPEAISTPASTPPAHADAQKLELRQLFLTAEHDSLRRRAAEALMMTQPDFLATTYEKPEYAPPIRSMIEAMVAARDTAVLPLLALLFAQRGGEERIDFEVALLAFGHRAVSWLAPLLRSGDTAVVMRVLDALGKLRAVDKVGDVAALLQHDDSWVKIAAAHALGDIGGSAAIAPLMAALDDSSYAVVNAAMTGLGRLHAAAAYERLIAFTGDENKHLRKHAAMALGDLGDERAIDAVRELADADADPGVRFVARRALTRLTED